MAKSLDRFRPYTVSFVGGLNEESSTISGDPVGFKTLQDVVFNKKGAINLRPSYSRDNAANSRALASGVGGTISSTDQSNFAATGYTPNVMFKVRDGHSERPAILSYGRTHVYESGRWMDMAGGCASRVTRFADFSTGISNGVLPGNVFACGPSFGWCDVVAAGPANTVMIVDTDGSTKTIVSPSPALGTGVGTGARCGVTDAFVWVPAGSNSLYMAIRAGNAVSEVLLDNVAKTPTGRGDAPVICCDSDQTTFFVAYLTTTARQIKIARVSTTGTVGTTATVTMSGAGASQCLWVTSTSSATNKLLVAGTTTTQTQVETFVFNATTLASSGINHNITVSGGTNVFRQVVCGAADATKAYLAFREVATGSLWIYTRSMTAASSTLVWKFTGADYGTAGSDANGPEFNLLHQPIKVKNRVILGVSVQHCFVNDSALGTPATWYDLDITDTAGLVLTGAKKIGVMVARGPIQGTTVAWQPVSAVTDGTSSWVFPVAEYREFQAGNTNTIYTGFTSAADSAGLKATLGLTKVEWLQPQADSAGASTVIGGNIPHEISGGWCYEHGFPFMGAPSISLVQGVGTGALNAGSYTLSAIWAWYDEAGRRQESAPAVANTMTVGAGDKITVTCPVYQITEREFGTIHLEVYASAKDAAAGSPMFRVADLDATPTGSNSTVSVAYASEPSTVALGTGVPLYTAGGILANRPVAADGGVCQLGRRLFMSDGDAVYASKLIVTGYGINFNDDDPLTLKLPENAGQVVALHRMDEKLVICCEHGIYITGGDGPEDDGSGNSFAEPIKVTDVGQRATQAGVPTSRLAAMTPKGLVFLASGGATDQGDVVLWLFDRSLQLIPASTIAQDTLADTAIVDMAWCPERQWLFMLRDSENTLVWDFDVDRWTTWTNPDGNTTMVCAQGVPWGIGAEPGRYDGTSDADIHSTSTLINWLLETKDLAPDGGQGFSWFRVRSVHLLGELDATNPTIAIQATLDQSRIYALGGTFTANGTPSTSWPVNALNPEFRLPTQKCRTISIRFGGTGGQVTLTGLMMMYKPISFVAPAGARF